MKKKLTFSFNWNNKLDCNCFTTLRLSNRFNICDKVEILLKEKFISQGEIIGKKELQSIELINEFIARIDTGYSAHECKQILKTMYKNKNIDWEKQKLYLYLVKKICCTT